MHHLLERPAQRTFSLDGSKTAVAAIFTRTVITGAIISQPRNSDVFLDRVSPSEAWTTYLSTCLEFWAWFCRHFFHCLRVPIDRQRRETVIRCEGTTRPPRICCGGVGGDWNLVPVPSCVSSASSKCHPDGISRQRMYVVSTQLPPTVSLAGISAPLLMICAPFVPINHGRVGNWGPSAFLCVLRRGPRTHATHRWVLD